MSIFIEIEGENYMLNELITRYPLLESIRDEIERAYNTIVECYEHDGKVHSGKLPEGRPADF